jgi:hypothetical protein
VAASDVLSFCRSMAALGFDALIVAVDSPGIYRPGALDVWGRELLPAIRRLPVAGR